MTHEPRKAAIECVQTLGMLVAEMDSDERMELVEAINYLGAYVDWTHHAIRHRLVGNIEHAAQRENAADLNYNHIPFDYRW